jgi:hypothetical protein
LFATMDPQAILEDGKKSYFEAQNAPSAAIPTATHS